MPKYTRLRLVLVVARGWTSARPHQKQTQYVRTDPRRTSLQSGRDICSTRSTRPTNRNSTVTKPSGKKENVNHSGSLQWIASLHRKTTTEERTLRELEGEAKNRGKQKVWREKTSRRVVVQDKRHRNEVKTGAEEKAKKRKPLRQKSQPKEILSSPS